jgi:RNA recognition motif-containing protein
MTNGNCEYFLRLLVPEEGTAKLYVGNLSFDTTVDQLKEYFGEFGEVRDFYMPLTPEGGPRGFGFVTLKEEDLDAVMEATNGSEFMGRNLVVSVPLAPGERTVKTKKSKIYVGNLSFYTSADTIAEVFSEFGEVYDVFLPEDANTGNPRGFGFVTMDPSAAEEAIFELDGMELDGRPIRVNEAMSKSKKQQPRSFDDDNYDDDDEESPF